MGFAKIRQRCRKCGGRGVLCRDTEPYPGPCVTDGLFTVVCEQCGEETVGWWGPNPAIRNWNEMNTDSSQEGGVK
jgi:hypothetical protein